MIKNDAHCKCNYYPLLCLRIFLLKLPETAFLLKGFDFNFTIETLHSLKFNFEFEKTFHIYTLEGASYVYLS